MYTLSSFVPETKGQNLEELDARFSIPTLVHMRQSIPNLVCDIRYYLLRQKDYKRSSILVNAGPSDLEAELTPRKKPLNAGDACHIDRLVSRSTVKEA